MKQTFFAILLSLLAIAPTVYTKPTNQSIQVNFSSLHRSLSGIEFDAAEDDFQYCMNALTSFADIQKKRKLTVEETLNALKIIIFIFQQYEDDAKKIDIKLNNTTTLALPYSSTLFLELLYQMQNMEQSDSNNN